MFYTAITFLLHRPECLIELRLESLIGKLRDALEFYRQLLRLAQFLLQPRHNLTLNGERRERKRIIRYIGKLEIVYISAILQLLN